MTRVRIVTVALGLLAAWPCYWVVDDFAVGCPQGETSVGRERVNR